jgi:hypothetical protein
MVVSEITLYNLLKSKYGESDAQTMVEGIRQTVKEEVNNKKDLLASKEDVALVKQDLLKLQIDIEKRFNQLTFWIVGTDIASAGLIIGLARFH